MIVIEIFLRRKPFISKLKLLKKKDYRHRFTSTRQSYENFRHTDIIHQQPPKEIQCYEKRNKYTQTKKCQRQMNTPTTETIKAATANIHSVITHIRQQQQPKPKPSEKKQQLI